MQLEDPLEVGTFIEVKGNKVFYRQAGSGDPIVLLHGFPTSSYDWRKLLAPLSKFGKVIAPDLYGFGYSDLPIGDEPTAAKLFPFLDDFASSMKIQRFRLVGCDWGGGIAAAYAVNFPASISKLVLMNMTVYPNWGEHFQKSRAYSQVRRMASSGFYRIVARALLTPKQVRRMISPKSEFVISDEELRQYVFFVKRAIGEMAKLYSKESAQAVQESMAGVRSKLRGFEVPTLLLWSENDPYVPPENGKRLNQDIQGSKLVILENTGHFIMEERPQQVIEALSIFLGG